MKIRLIIVCFVSVLLASCSEHIVFSEQKELPKYGWDKNDAIAFEASMTDTFSAYDVLITLRNDETYPNQNLWLFIDETAPDGTLRKDTVQCFLVDNQGHWIGSGVGSLHYVSVYYKQQCRFSQQGIYRYNIKHGMRYDQLQGLNDIGIKIQKTSEE